MSTPPLPAAEPDPEPSGAPPASSRVQPALRMASGAAQSLWQGVQAAPQLATQRAAMPYAVAEDHIGEALLRELHTYPRKNLTIMRLAWGIGGLAGAHRFYAGQIGWALLMMFTLGGLSIWWIRDAFHLRRMVEAYNNEQMRRQLADEPPIGMEFVPKASPEVLAALPDWAPTKRRSFVRKAAGLTADLFVLFILCVGLGALSNELPVSTSLYAVLAIVFVVNGAPLLLKWHDWPVASTLLRWDYKLRLFYHFNKPGNAAQLFMRMVTGIFVAPFSKKGRAEVRLYLEVAGLFAVISGIWKVFSGDLWLALRRFDMNAFMSTLMETWVQSQFIGFVLVYMFTACIGATLMKHTLLRRPRWVQWLLSALVVWALYFGTLQA